MLWKKTKCSNKITMACKATLSKGSPSYVWSNIEHVFFRIALIPADELWLKIFTEVCLIETPCFSNDLERFDFLRSCVEQHISDFLLEYIKKNNIRITKENFDCFSKIEILDKTQIDTIVLLIMGEPYKNLIWEEN